METAESRDTYEILIARPRSGSIIVTSNRGSDEWLTTFADPVRAQSAIDRFTSKRTAQTLTSVAAQGWKAMINRSRSPGREK